MHRLLKVKQDNFQRIQNLLLQTRQLGYSGIKNPCLVCKRVHIPITNGFSQVRLIHGGTNPQVRPVKKRAKIKRKYAEILVVGEKNAKEQKATVQRLNPKDLKIFTTTELNLSELYKLKLLSSTPITAEEYSYNNLRIIENIPIITESSLFENSAILTIPSESNSIEALNEIELDGDISLPSTSLYGAFQPAFLDEPAEEIEEEPTTSTQPLKIPSKIKKQATKKSNNQQNQPYQQIETAARRENYIRTVTAYIEVCAALNNPQRGFNALLYYSNQTHKNKTSRRFPHLKDIKVYNALLKGFAGAGNFPKIQEVLEHAEGAGVKLDARSYACIFECLARVNYDNNHMKYLRIYAKRAEWEGFGFDRILNEVTFEEMQKELVLKAMRAVQPDYEPRYWPPNVSYDNPLLNHLNTEGKKKNAAAKDGIFKDTDWKKLIKEQIKIEEEGFIKVESIESPAEPTPEVLQYRQIFDEHITLWRESAAAAFHRDLAALTAKRSALNLEVYMRSIPAKDFVEIIIDEAKKITQGSESYSPSVQQLHRMLGAKVYMRYLVIKKQKSGTLKKIANIQQQYCKEYRKNHPKLDTVPDREIFENPRKSWQLLEHSMRAEGASIVLEHNEWIPSVIQSIGKFLYHIIMHDLKINVNSLRLQNRNKNYLPAFYSLFRNQNKTIKEEVKPHPVLSRLHRASMQKTLTFPAYEVPMLCPPVPWISVGTGGYLLAPCDMIRLPSGAITQRQRLDESDPRQLYPSFDSLNQLASVPWMVNKRVLDVLIEVFTSGGSHKLDVPEPPSSLKPPPGYTPGMDKVEKYQVLKQKMQHKRKKAEMYSLWCDCLYRLSLTNHFRDKIFWLPHNMDFRGRVYPVPPHLTHLGSDLARSTLVFAEARPLGKEGLNWLKLHLVNLTGLKKRDSIANRLAFADSILPEILDSADRPLTGRRWWTDSDEPWQTLACCFEIAAAVRSGDPEKYMCHYPIHQDGSCNGLQHYAALGRDSHGAFSVNLVPSELPQDVYSLVAGLVEKQRAADALGGLEVAKILEGFVKRKVIKQTVMTTVYGVTRYGAKLQIARQLKDIDDFPKEHVWIASTYLTAKTFESLRSMFTSTREIQDWFTECARLISSVGEQNVEWVTPLGLPVVQPYFRFKKSNATLLGYFQMDKFERPNTMKQKNAFPPNFIHSLDSSHMILTSLHCERAGITFVSVHDCYWTHPSTVHIMNRICREQFVALHSQPILENLSVFLSEKYSYSDNEMADDGSMNDFTKKKLNKVLRQLPKTGDFDIREVLKSVFFFS